jgi:hypothetical protein
VATDRLAVRELLDQLDQILVDGSHSFLGNGRIAQYISLRYVSIRIASGPSMLTRTPFERHYFDLDLPFDPEARRFAQYAFIRRPMALRAAALIRLLFGVRLVRWTPRTPSAVAIALT